MVIWVAVGAVVVLRERIGWGHVAAIGALVLGQAFLGVNLDTLRPGGGELMILAATWLWSVEVVLAKRLLAWIDPVALALWRMGLGSLLLVAWLAASGQVAALGPQQGTGWLWVVMTGSLLGAYVLCWYSALSRAGAIDVTAVLVLAVLITAFLEDLFKGTALAPQWPGLVLIAVGVLAACWLSWSAPASAAPTEGLAP